jgi:hypothetical protein
VLWLAVTALGLAWGPPGVPLLFAVLGLYLVGPLWIPVAYRAGDDGLERRTAFGRRLWTWPELGAWEVRPRERTAYLYPRGRGTARFVPPVLVLWEEDDAAADLAGRLAALLAAHVEEGRLVP